ncbi:MAG: hypothetical protein BWY11_02224 [Firmicutes bacterium ADurb.Bin182]|nr:MAG: hypothetical protein BWY11_02224 [Firmicutes bacterium ADurb.Bin182]
MKQKLIFLWHVLIFNIIKPLPNSSDYFNRYFQLPTQNLSDHNSHYKRIVKFGKEQSGWAGVLLANIALMFFCLPICFSADLVIHSVYLLSIKISINVILVLIMLGKFDMLRFRDNQSFLKLFYLFSCLVSSSYWTLTCLFLAAFENIVL